MRRTICLLIPLIDNTDGASVPFIVEVIWFEWCHCQRENQRPDLQMIPSSLSTPCGNCLEEKSRKLYNWGIVKIVSNPYTGRFYKLEYMNKVRTVFSHFQF